MNNEEWRMQNAEWRIIIPFAGHPVGMRRLVESCRFAILCMP